MLSVFRPAVMRVTGPVSAPANALRMLNTSSVVMAAKKKVVDPTLPSVPRGPPTAYTLFFKSYVGSSSSNHLKPDGKLDMRSLTSSAGTAWSNLSSSEKQSYESQASEAKRSYEKAYQAFWESTTPETRDAIKKATGKEVKPPGGKKAFKQSVAARAGNPGKPLTAFFGFAKDVRDEGRVAVPGHLEGNERQQFIAKETGNLWKALSESEKQKYKDQYTEQKAKWETWKSTQADKADL
ncbi:hypothetical protein CI109_101537 [Kwoniella shandongensis]|uniref:Uncharacterized protein n=1 Tax=Kwoniella shandongensis TaxID=1734106 RepID=A0A5M6C5W4_9TREE|nr:uncharacterized protein CI109_001331 [Kwoniella shandongensis]KAA5530527.1 hypothetical protein CI109_001331 [Kwoniella shandongensis]